MISHKTYYRASDIRAFVQENADCKTYERFKRKINSISKPKQKRRIIHPFCKVPSRPI